MLKQQHFDLAQIKRKACSQNLNKCLFYKFKVKHVWEQDAYLFFKSVSIKLMPAAVLHCMHESCKNSHHGRGFKCNKKSMTLGEFWLHIGSF